MAPTSRKDSNITSAAPPSRRLSPLDACHIDVFDSSENCHMSEIVEAIGRTGHVKITYGRIPDNLHIFLSSGFSPDDHHLIQATSLNPFHLDAHCTLFYKPSPSSHAHSERSNQRNRIKLLNQDFKTIAGRARNKPTQYKEQPPRLSTQLPVNRADLPVAPSINGADSDIVLIWPFEAERNSQSVAITNGDLKRLAEGEFLNDTLIEFGLLWELSEIRKRDPELVTSIHLFNSFFFQKLSGCKSKEVSQYRTTRYEAAVTTIVDPYHTCRTAAGEAEAYAGAIMPGGGEPRSEKSCYFSTSDELSKANSITAAQATAAGEGQTSNSNSNVNVAVETSAQALQEMELDDQKSPVQEDTTTADAPTTGAKQDASLPYVLTLDSLGSPHRPQSSTILRYLINEAKDKLEQTLPESLSKSVCIKKVPVPEQPNFCDCGLYLIHAFKTFFKEPKGMLRWILDHNNKKGPKEQRLAEVCETWNAAGAAQARQALRDQIQALRPQYDELARRRKEAAAEKKQARMRKLADIEGPQASNPESAKKQPLDQSEPNDHNTKEAAAEKKEQPRTRKLSHTEDPQASNPESAKKQRLDYPGPNDQNTSAKSIDQLNYLNSSSPAPPPKRFLEGSSNSKAEKDQLFHRLSTSSITKTFSPCPAQDQRSIEDIPDQRDIIVDVSPDPTPPKDDSMDMLDDRPVTPDDDLILTGIPIPLMSPRTPENSPPGDQKPSETKKDVPDRQIVGVPATPPEEPDYDGEALAPEQPEENAVIDPSSPLSDAESSIRMASPQPTPTSRRSSRRENTTIGSATQNPRSAEAIAGSTSRPGGENFTKQSKGGLPPQDNMFHLFNIHSAHNHHNRTHRPNDHNNNTSNNNNNNTSNNNNNHTNNKNKSNNHPNNSYTRNPHHPQNQSHKNKTTETPTETAATTIPTRVITSTTNPIIITIITSITTTKTSITTIKTSITTIKTSITTIKT
ncbi:hypothetical protein H4Q26_007785 [Puccinia striiformis f. sp. tritici PST-130]|nr:hypothetical protein H4Q26_007785 [Puccinia striiformis f. sp. tritici PST-130]